MTSPTPHSSTRVSCRDLLVLLAILLSVGLVWWSAATHPRFVGFWGDDSIYLVTGKAVADGEGYRRLDLPSEPLQTKYPPLYPLVLAAVWKIWPRFPENIPLFQACNALLWAVGAWLAYMVMRRAWLLPRWLAGSAVVLATMRPLTMRLILAPMSEPLFIVLSMGCLLVLRPRVGVERGRSSNTSVMRSAGAALLGAAAYLTRSIGIVLLPVIALDLFARWRWKQAIVAGVIFSGALVGWQSWRGQASGTNAETPVTQQFVYDLQYGAWVPRDLSTLAWVAFHNTSELGMELFRSVTQTPVPWLGEMAGRGLGGGAPLYIGTIAVVALAIAGTVRLLSWRGLGVHLYLAGYLALVCIWPFPPLRMLAPINALLAALVFVGLHWLVTTIARLITRRTASAELNWNGRVAAAVVLVLVVIFGVRGVHPLVTKPMAERWLRGMEARDELVATLTDVTEPDATICAVDGAYLHLRTGRKFATFMPYENPVPHYYPPDRKWLQGGQVKTPGAREAGVRQVYDGLLDYLRATRSRYLVPVKAQLAQGEGFRRVKTEHPEVFPRHISVRGGYFLFAVELPAE